MVNKTNEKAKVNNSELVEGQDINQLEKQVNEDESEKVDEKVEEKAEMNQPVHSRKPKQPHYSTDVISNLKKKIETDDNEDDSIIVSNTINHCIIIADIDLDFINGITRKGARDDMPKPLSFEPFQTLNLSAMGLTYEILDNSVMFVNRLADGTLIEGQLSESQKKQQNFFQQDVHALYNSIKDNEGMVTVNVKKDNVYLGMLLAEELKNERLNALVGTSDASTKIDQLKRATGK